MRWPQPKTVRPETNFISKEKIDKAVTSNVSWGKHFKKAINKFLKAADVESENRFSESEASDGQKSTDKELEHNSETKDELESPSTNSNVETNEPANALEETEIRDNEA